MAVCAAVAAEFAALAAVFALVVAVCAAVAAEFAALAAFAAVFALACAAVALAWAAVALAWAAVADACACAASVAAAVACNTSLSYMLGVGAAGVSPPISESSTPILTIVVVSTCIPSEPRTDTLNDDSVKTSDGTMHESDTSATQYDASYVLKVAVLI